ncbi:MAG: DNA-binding protein [Clostridia bacterium]|nr:helix-turn-helix domain-containing protein [Lachnospiraceae bacterium]NCB99930.1 DNA-binding protein [Clostridia bacterium]NCD04043.1 DNA-binding protein [Clostridia bacterium]
MVEPYKPLYSVKEAAKVLLVNPSTVYQYINEGKLLYVPLGSKKIRGIDLEKFINSYPEGEVMKL